MRRLLIASLALLAAPASAEVIGAAPNGFHIRHVVEVKAEQQAAFADFALVHDWWDKNHTYSGDARNLRMSLLPGGCFCETLPNGGGIEHMRIAYFDRGKRIVLTGSLGPLLYEATSAVMDVKFEPAAGGTRVMMDYKAAGFAAGGADKLARPVDAVLGQQFARYAAYAGGS